MATPGSRIFVSSTCYDLLDLRAEVEQHLREMGLTPVMSDRPTAEFDVPGYRDSIETCLVNVRNSDAFICILSQRYGPSLKDSGYDDLSATHIEYREARKEKLPIWMYVRDRTAGEHSTWSKNRRAATQPMFRWVAEGDGNLFGCIEEHRKLVAGSEASNWFDIFRDAGDLRVLLSRDLRGYSGPAILQRLLEQEALPMLSIESLGKPRVDSQQRYVSIALRAAGGQPALNVVFVQLPHGPNRHPGDIAPGQERKVNLELPKPTGGPGAKAASVRITYHTIRGIKIEETFDLLEELNGGLRAECVEKRFAGGPPFRLA